MQIEKFTTKAQAALQSAQQVAREHGNQEIDGEHLLAALLAQEDGLILPLLEKLDVPKEKFSSDLGKLLDAKPKVQGTTSSDTFMGNALKKSLDAAEAQAAKLK